jgi:hypothetical protein
MTETSFNLSIPFKTLLTSLKALSYEKKVQLLEMLEQQLEEERLEKNPEIQMEIEAARTAYQVGDSITLDEYKAQNPERLK